MIWAILGVVVLVGSLMVAVALCKSSVKGDSLMKQRRKYDDFWQG